MRDEWSIEVTATRTTQIDESEVRRATEVLFRQEQYHLIQSLPSGRWAFVRTSDSQSLAVITSLSDGDGLYFSLNAVKEVPKHGKCLRSSDVQERQWFLIDIDTKRPSTDVMATEAEKESSNVVALATAKHLTSKGWPAPVLIDSGNGWHLLYRINLPATKLTQQTLRLCLVNLGKLFDNDAAHVDHATHDAKRISKLPGSWVRKGSNTTERPWRLARIIHAPPVVEAVTFEQLQELATDTGKGDAYEEPEPPKKDDWTIRTGNIASGPAGYLSAALQNELVELALAKQGERNNALNKAAFSLGQLIEAGLDRGKVEFELRHAATLLGLGTIEIERTIASGLGAGLAEPRAIPERTAQQSKQSKNGKHDGPAFEPGTLLIVRASEITPKRVEFLWPGRIPLGKLTTFAGQGGIGKTFIICDMAARISRGDTFPDSGGECFEPGNVLIINGEDDEEDTTVPRLIECGADLNRIAFLKGEVQDSFYLSALELLSRAVDQLGDVRLVAIDPPSNYLGDADEHKNAEIRALLRKYKNWCAERRISVILNTHVNKNVGPNADAASRVMGTVAWVNAVRSAHLFARDPDDFDRTLFIPFKVNSSKRVPGLAYKIVSTTELARVEWLGEVNQTADEIVKGAPRKPAHVSAKEWLETVPFKTQREWLSDEIKRAASEAGISKGALWDAKKLLPIVARLKNTADGETHWWWIAEHGWPPPQKV